MPGAKPTGATPAPGNDYAAQFNPGFALDPARVALHAAPELSPEVWPQARPGHDHLVERANGCR